MKLMLKSFQAFILTICASPVCLQEEIHKKNINQTTIILKGFQDDTDILIKPNCLKCTQYEKSFRNLLTRRKRKIVFPQDGAILITFSIGKALLGGVSKGIAMTYEVDQYNPVPDTLEKWIPAGFVIKKNQKIKKIDEDGEHVNYVTNQNNFNNPNPHNYTQPPKFHFNPYPLNDHLIGNTLSNNQITNFPNFLPASQWKINPYIKKLGGTNITVNHDNKNIQNWQYKIPTNNKKIDKWKNWNQKYFDRPIYPTRKKTYPSDYKFRQPIKYRYDLNRFNRYENYPSYHRTTPTKDYSNEWKYHRGHRERREIFNQIEQIGSIFGVNMKYCVLRTICEVKHFMLPRGISLIHDIMRIVFTLPYKEHWKDDYIETAKSEDKNCKLMYEGHCPISVLEFLIHSDRNII